jgi:hypothetical protein
MLNSRMQSADQGGRSGNTPIHGEIAQADPIAGKRILFIGIGFYDYETAIKRRLERFGASVTYFLEQPRWHQSAFLRRLSAGLGIGILASRERYQRRLLKLIASIDFDYAFVIKGELLSEDFVAQLRAHNPRATFILYQWDSIRRTPSALRLRPYFNRALSFDRQDCQEHPDFVFRPLFYRDDAQNGEHPPTSLSYDLTFVGWFHSDRLDRLLAIESAFRARGLRVHFYLYTGVGTYLRHLVRGEHRLLHFRRLPFEHVSKIMAASKCVLDLPHADQNGLTMRAIETIGMRRKLVTTSSDIVNYDFYDRRNILSIRELKAAEIASFVAGDSVSVPENVLHKYSLDKWLEDVFGLSSTAAWQPQPRR